MKKRSFLLLFASIIVISLFIVNVSATDDVPDYSDVRYFYSLTNDSITNDTGSFISNPFTVTDSYEQFNGEQNGYFAISDNGTMTLTNIAPSDKYVMTVSFTPLIPHEDGTYGSRAGYDFYHYEGDGKYNSLPVNHLEYYDILKLRVGKSITFSLPDKKYVWESNNLDYDDLIWVMILNTYHAEAKTVTTESGTYTEYTQTPGDTGYQLYWYLKVDNDAVNEINSNKCGKDVTWALDENGVLTISGTGEMYNWDSNSYTPWYYLSSSIKRVIIKDGVTNIGNHAFYNFGSIESIEIPASVISIGEKAIDSCSGLESITVDSNNENYSNDERGVLFNKDKTILIQYPAGNTATSYKIPAGVTIVDSYAFYKCLNLTDIEISNSVTFIGFEVFRECCNLESVTFEENSSLEGIYYGAFADCTSLTSIDIPYSVTRIYDYAFSGCTSLSSITITYSVTSIDDYAFENCANFTIHGHKDTCAETYARENSIPFVVIETQYSITYNANGGKNVPEAQSKTHGTDITLSTAIPTRDDGYAFIGWTTKIGGYIEYVPGSTYTKNAHVTLYAAWGINSGVCGDDITWHYDDNCVLTISGTGKMYDWDTDSSVPWYHFTLCMKSVVIEDGVTSIGDYAFFNFESIESIRIPDSVTSISENALDYCFSLESITVDSNNENYSNDERGVLFNKDKTTLIQYPAGNTAASYKIPSGVTSIGDYAFKNCSNLTCIDIPASVISIGYNAFNSCWSLESVAFEENSSLTYIGPSAFYGCESLASIEIPASVRTLGDNAFAYCLGLASITFEENSSLTYIYDFTFSGCESLTSIDIPYSVTEIDGLAFSGCTNLSRIYIPYSVTYIGDSAFDTCPNLTIHGYKYSYAETYASENSIPFVADKILSYSITYNANGGENAPEVQTKNHGTDITLSTAVPTLDGYTFVGWSTSANGEVEYTSGANYTNNADVTLYAVWELITENIDSVALSEISILDLSFEPLDKIPSTSFVIEITAKNIYFNGTPTIVIVYYDNTGRMLDIINLSSSPEKGNEQTFISFLENTDGKVAKVKAMAFDSLSSFSPLTESVEINK